MDNPLSNLLITVIYYAWKAKHGYRGVSYGNRDITETTETTGNSIGIKMINSLKNLNALVLFQSIAFCNILCQESN